VSRPLRITEQLLLIARRDARNLGAQLVVLVIPERSQVMRPEESAHSGLDALEQQFVSWFEREEILHVEALTPLRGARQRGENPFFQRDGHLNSAGHRVVGETLARRFVPLLQQESSENSRACARELSAQGARAR
jgi:hypothetical protein